VKVVVRSGPRPPTSLYSAAMALRSCPGCVGSIELYEAPDGWHADVMHESTCWYLLSETDQSLRIVAHAESSLL